MTIRRLQAALVCATLSLATLARADDPANTEAQARFREGLELADNAKYDDARLKFLQASAVLKSPAVLFNLASTEQKTGHDVEAIEHYRAFLESGKSDARITDAMREKAKQNIQSLLEKVAQIAVDAPPGTKVSIDGKAVDDPATAVPVTPGRHTVEGTFDGKSRSTSVDGKRGAITTAKLDFANVVTAYAAPAGDEPHRSTAGWVVPITIAVVGAGAVVGGIVTSSASNTSTEEADRAAGKAPAADCGRVTSPYCDAIRTKRDDADTQSTLAAASFISGGVLLVGAIAAFVFWPTTSSSSAHAMRLTPRLAGHPAGAGGALLLSF